jgi:phosphoesterase RecJ-like protein
MLPIQDALPLLKDPAKIYIVTHHKPDGDAIGSILALYHYLLAKGHAVTAVAPSEVPDFLRWMPGCNVVINHEAETEKSLKAMKEAELIFGLDFNDFSRTKHLTQHLTDAPQYKIMIDHHLLPADQWSFGMSNPARSSTCEMVYDFINLCGDNNMITQEIATCLYVGAMTDTGSFKFPATTASVHLMIADLMTRGINHTAIHEEVYDAWSESRMRFLGYILMDKMVIFRKYNAAMIALSRKDMQLFNAQNGDTEGIVNYPLSIAGIRFSTLITERADEVKLSFRSKGMFDVSNFARLYFEGGGHFNASGGRSRMNLEETISYYKKILSDIHPK